MSKREAPKLNNRETVKDLEDCIANVERGIFALEMDIYGDEQHQANLEQLYILKRAYEKDLHALKNKKYS